MGLSFIMHYVDKHIYLVCKGSFPRSLGFTGANLKLCNMYITSSLLATVLFATVLKLSCTFETIFIKTNNSSNHQCLAEPCLTLQEFLAHHHRVESNTVLKFLPGNHLILFATSQNISVINVVNVTLTGVNGQQSSSIYCLSEFSVSVKNAKNVTISKLSFFGCGAAIRKQTTAYDNSLPRLATLLLVQTLNVSILDVHVHGSIGAGMLVVSGFDLTLNRTSFVFNKPNCVVMFVDGTNPPVKLHVSSYIADTEFTFGRSNSMMYAGGLDLAFMQTSYTVYVNISNVALYNNTGRYWGSFLMTIEEWSCKYTVVRAEKIRCSNYRYSFQSSMLGFAVWERASDISVSPHQDNQSLQFEYTLNILDSYFDTNLGIMAAVNVKGRKKLRVKFTDVVIEGKSDDGLVGLRISNMSLVTLKRMRVFTCKHIPIQVTNSKITMFDTLVEENEGVFMGVVQLWKSQVTFLGNTVFTKNYAHNGPGVFYAHSSSLIFQGTVEFVNNTGYDGGALALYAGSQIVIGRHAHIKFIRNHVKHFGGAVYIENSNHRVLSEFLKILCFYELDTSNTSINPHVLFENNTADYAGSALYGGWIDFCRDPKKTLMRLDFDSLFQVNGRESDPSVISSNPLRVCLCVESKPNCSITDYNTVAYPGTTIKLSAVAVGQRFGTVPTTVHSDFLYELMDGIHPEIKDWQHTQKVDKHCTELMYTIMSPPQVKLTMKVKVERSDTSDWRVSYIHDTFIFKSKTTDQNLIYIANFKIRIKMLPCPLGFEYDNTSMMCTCDSQLVKSQLNCSIDTQTVWRKSSFWITTVEESGEVLVHAHCPFDYCKPESFDLDLEDLDEQCAFHRSGILCGACQNNLSHVFGTSACRECSSLWALLWCPVIALAGIALVVLLIVLNLTVSVGTINGLIFYANIVRANHATFFPPNTTNSFLSWFIAWINLDLGIETCFYNGLDAYVKTWLQFVFPLYIWFLVITIIVLSHYSTFAARLSGRNAVPVLATLFLMSYAKLLRIIITVFQSTELEYLDNSVRKIWLYDGNVDYLKGKHILLFIAALLLLLISLPYTAVLIFIQYLQHRSSYRVLFWVKKLKPLFDAYTGPYKDNHRYWTGLLLLVRIVLFLIFSMNTRGSTNINLLAISLTVLLLFMHVVIVGSVYQTWHMNIFEYSFFLNLGILASATLYTTVTGQGQTAVAYTSVSIAFVLFIIIVLFHILTKLKSTQHYNWISVNIVRKLRVKLSKFRSALKKLCCKEKRPHQNTPPRVTRTTVELRESLLEYCSQ